MGAPVLEKNVYCSKGAGIALGSVRFNCLIQSDAAWIDELAKSHRQKPALPMREWKQITEESQNGDSEVGDHLNKPSRNCYTAVEAQIPGHHCQNRQNKSSTATSMKPARTPKAVFSWLPWS